MRRVARLPWVALAALFPTTAQAHVPPRDGVGSLVSVSVEIEGATAPLYRAPDGSDRFYVEARPQARYVLRLANNSHERLAVAITVDGLNVISGERDPRPAGSAGADGRMYVLGPWETIAVRGWRTSLDEVRRFTFVDEQRSYAARSGKANARMGWIELAVYREVHPRAEVAPLRRGRDVPPPADAREGEAARDDAGARGEADAAGEAPAHEGDVARRPPSASAPRSYPGTGWGERTDDAATLVDFDPQPYAAERLTLRYEYAAGLRALGIDVRPWLQARDRLRERDRGERGFAQPPLW